MTPYLFALAKPLPLFVIIGSATAGNNGFTKTTTTWPSVHRLQCLHAVPAFCETQRP